MVTLTLRLFCTAISILIFFYPAPYIPSTASQYDAFVTYYTPDKPAVYGYATRYGSWQVAFDELLWEAHEYAAQRDHGFALIGGGYGYYWIDGRRYLAYNRFSYAYSWLIKQAPRPPTANQRRLARLATMDYGAAYAYVHNRYIGIISTRSPNDIGREYCLLTAPDLRPVGLVIVGGVAARHDYLPYGNSVNDDFGHQRLGQRVMQIDGQPWMWLADVTDSILLWMDWEGGPILIALGPPYLCRTSCAITAE